LGQPVGQKGTTIWAPVLLAYASLFAFGFLDNSRGPLFPFLLEDFRITDTAGSWLFSVSSLTSFFASFCSHWILSLVGSPMALRISMFLMGLGFTCLGLGDNFWTALLGSGVFGLGQGLIAVAQHTLIQDHSNPLLWRRLFSGLHCNYGLASLLAPLVFSYGLDFDLSWRTILFGIASLPLVIALFSFKLNIKRVNKEQIQSNSKSHLSWFQDILNLREIFFSLILAAYLVGELSLSSRLVLYLQRVSQWTNEDSSFALSGFFLLLFLSRFVFFIFSIGKVESSRLILLICLFVSAFFFSLGLLFHPIFLILSGASLGPFFPLFVEMLAQFFGVRSGKVFSTAMALGTLSVVFMHFVLGYLSDSIGIQFALWVGPLGLVFSSIMLSTFITKNPLCLDQQNFTSKL
ncbi:MAG: MFS transporter, partial [Bdellovibrionales bacterium]|nr:MFS transporter [Bdellovibrionales bacterium]